MKTAGRRHGIQHPALRASSRFTNRRRRCAGLLMPVIPPGSGAPGPVDHRRHRRLDHHAVLQLLDAGGADQRAGLAGLRARRRRDRLPLHGALRHLGDADRQPGVLHGRRDDLRCAGGAEDGGDAGRLLGPFGVYAYSIGFWAAVFASLLGVWQSVPYLYADFYGIMKTAAAARAPRVTQVTSTPYRLALLFITLAPMPFAFMRPAAVHHRHLHDCRQPLHAVPRRDAALPEQPRPLARAGAAQSLDDERRAGRILALFVVVGAQEVINAL